MMPLWTAAQGLFWNMIYARGIELLAYDIVQNGLKAVVPTFTINVLWDDFDIKKRTASFMDGDLLQKQNKETASTYVTSFGLEIWTVIGMFVLMIGCVMMRWVRNPMRVVKHTSCSIILICIISGILRHKLVINRFSDGLQIILSVITIPVYTWIVSTMILSNLHNDIDVVAAINQNVARAIAQEVPAQVIELMQEPIQQVHHHLQQVQQELQVMQTQLQEVQNRQIAMLALPTP